MIGSEAIVIKTIRVVKIDNKVMAILMAFHRPCAVLSDMIVTGDDIPILTGFASRLSRSVDCNLNGFGISADLWWVCAHSYGQRKTFA